MTTIHMQTEHVQEVAERLMNQTITLTYFAESLKSSIFQVADSVEWGRIRSFYLAVEEAIRSL